MSVTGKSQRERIAAEQRRRGDVERRFQQARQPRQAPDFERGMAELAEKGIRLTASDLRAIENMDARYGLPGLKQGLSNAGFSEDALYVLEAQYQRGGLAAVSRAVQAEAVAQAEAGAEQEAAAALDSLQPAQWNAAAQILAADPSGQRLAQEARALGLSPAAAVAVARHVASSGVEQAHRLAAERVQARARADAAHAAAERDFEAAQKNPHDPFAAQEIHQAALDLYSRHAGELEAAGIGARAGESPTAWVRRVAQSGTGAAEKLAQAIGESPEHIRNLFDHTRTLEGVREVRSRLATSDDAARKARAINVPPERRMAEMPRKKDGTDAAMERAAKAIGYRDPNEEGEVYRAQDLDSAYLATASGQKAALVTKHGREQAQRVLDRRRDEADRHSKSIRGRIEQAEAHLAGRSSPQPERSETSSSGSGMSLEDALRAADAAVNGRGTDDE